MKFTFYTFILPVLAVLIVSFAYDREGTGNRLCKQEYALCTSALCIPQPGDPTKSICFCDVIDGPSLSTVPCDSVKPSTNENGVRTVYSAFSLEQFTTGKKGMKCPAGTPWSWCLNKKCTVDPSNPKKAICQCDVVRKDAWMTLGGNCDTSTCSTGYWSGATISDIDDAAGFLTKALGIGESPMKWCPAQ